MTWAADGLSAVSIGYVVHLPPAIVDKAAKLKFLDKPPVLEVAKLWTRGDDQTGHRGRGVSRRQMWISGGRCRHA
jgi:hypothetical protein